MEKLAEALATIGRNEQLRMHFIEVCREVEMRLARRDFDVREQVTGPIVDALHRDTGLLRKRLISGLKFHFYYRGKIARDLVMSEQSEPDHIWEPQTTRLLLHLSRNAKTVVIGGAYAGDQAILIADRIKAHGGVCHCFEPNAEQMEVLQYNAAANQLDNIAFNRLGLWDTEGANLVLIGYDACAYPEVNEGVEDQERTVRTTMLDAYGARLGIECVDVLMLDIEGGELAALRGGQRYLSQPSGEAPSIITDVHRNYVDWSNGLENTDILCFLREHHYKLFAIRDYQSNVPMTGLPIELIRPENAYLEGPPHGFNMLAVKDESVVQDSLFQLCAGVSPKLLRHRDPKLHQPLTAGS